MKAIVQYFHVVLFIILYRFVLTFRYGDETLVRDHSNERYWEVISCVYLLFSMVFKGIITFKSVDETLACVWPFKLNESYWAVLSCGTVYYAVQGGSWNPCVWPFKWKLLSSTFMWYMWLTTKSVVLFNTLYMQSGYIFKYMNEALMCDHSK